MNDTSNRQLRDNNTEMAGSYLVDQLPQRVGEEEEPLLGQQVEQFPQHLVDQDPLLGQVVGQLPQHFVEQDPLLGQDEEQLPQHLFELEHDPLLGGGQEVEQFPQHLIDQEPLLGPLLAAQRPNTEVFFSTVVNSFPQSHKFIFSRWCTL